MKYDYAYMPDGEQSFSNALRNTIENTGERDTWTDTYVRRIEYSSTSIILRFISNGRVNEILSLEGVITITTEFLLRSNRFTEEEKVKLPELVKQLILCPETANSYYSVFHIPKKSGGTRLIEAPEDLLKKIQRVLLQTLWYALGAPAKCSHGFVPKRGTKTCAQAHFNENEARQRVLLKMDLRDFFTSVSFGSLFNQIVNYVDRNLSGRDNRYQKIPKVIIYILRDHAKEFNIDIADKLPLLEGEESYYKASADTLFAYPALGLYDLIYGACRLCTVDERLPQGSPCSPALTNIFMQKFCSGVMHVINRICTEFPSANIEFTIYADDLIVTTSETRYAVKMRGILEKMIYEYPDISQNMEKTCIFRHGQPQRVTGIEITDKLSISRKQRDKVRAELHNAAAGKITLTAQDKMRLKGVRAWMVGVDPTGWNSRCEEDYNKVIGK